MSPFHKTACALFTGVTDIGRLLQFRTGFRNVIGADIRTAQTGFPAHPADDGAGGITAHSTPLAV